MYDARHVANEFIRLANEHGRSLTHLEIQKLVYFAHARMLSLHKEPLISGAFQAWRYGPVVRQLYTALKDNGANQVREPIPAGPPPQFTRRARDIIAWSFNRYSHLSGIELSKLTHAPEAPWYQTLLLMAETVSSPVIPNELIEQYYLGEWRPEIEATLARGANSLQIQAEVRRGMEEYERGDYSAATTLEEMQEMIARHAS